MRPINIWVVKYLSVKVEIFEWWYESGDHKYLNEIFFIDVNALRMEIVSLEYLSIFYSRQNHKFFKLKKNTF